MKVPGSEDGRACMAALSFDSEQLASKFKRLEKETLAGFLAHMSKNLPSYAIPRFLRLLEGAASVTATFKQVKVMLKKQGCDPREMEGDNLLWLSPSSRTYQPFHMDNYHQLADRRCRL